MFLMDMFNGLRIKKKSFRLCPISDICVCWEHREADIHTKSLNQLIRYSQAPDHNIRSIFSLELQIANKPFNTKVEDYWLLKKNNLSELIFRYTIFSLIKMYCCFSAGHRQPQHELVLLKEMKKTHILKGLDCCDIFIEIRRLHARQKETDEEYRRRVFHLCWKCFLPPLETCCRLSESIEERLRLKLLHNHVENVRLSMFSHLWGSVVITQRANDLYGLYSYRQSVTCWGRWCWPEDDQKDCTPWEDLRTEVPESVHLDWI